MERHPKDEATFDPEASLLSPFEKRELHMQCAGDDPDIIVKVRGKSLVKTSPLFSRCVSGLMSPKGRKQKDHDRQVKRVYSGQI